MSNVKSSTSSIEDEDSYQNSTKNKMSHQSIQSNFNYYSMSSLTSYNEIFYSNSESSGLLILPQENNMQNISLLTSSNFNTNNNYNMGHSTPSVSINNPIIKNDNIKGKNYSKKIESQCLKSHTKYDEKFLNEADITEILKLELSLKMIPENIGPYFKSLKHDVLQLTNSCMYNTNMDGIIKNINNIMKFTPIDIKTNTINYSIEPFVPIDMNTLHLLNDKLDHIYTTIDKLLDDGNFTKTYNVFSLPKTNIYNNDYINKSNYDYCIRNKSNAETIPSIYNSNKCNDDFNKSYHTNSYDDDHIGEKNLLNTISSINNGNSYDDSNDDYIENNISNTISFINNKNSYVDDDDDIREKNISNTISPTTNRNISIVPTLENSFINYSLQNELKLNNKESSEILTPNISLSNNELSVADNNCDDTYTSNNKNTKGYWLRHRPKSTDHFFSPFKSKIVKNKSNCMKTKYNDVIVYGGRGNNKVIIKYKVHSVSKANSSELINKICPKKKKCKYDNENTTFSDISNLIQKKKKPCRCGIFPSQVPSSWKNALHISLHKNLYKLQFKSQSTINAVKQINDNGFLYDIIKISKNCDKDEILKLTLKNIQDFINLEINYSKTNMNLNHSIFLAINPENKIIGYLEIDSIKNACIFKNNQLSENFIAVKFGVSKLWVMVMYRNNGVAKNLLKQFCDEENIKTNDIAFAYHGSHGISFIKNYFANNSVLIYPNTHFSP